MVYLYRQILIIHYMGFLANNVTNWKNNTSILHANDITWQWLKLVKKCVQHYSMDFVSSQTEYNEKILNLVYKFNETIKCVSERERDAWGWIWQTNEQKFLVPAWSSKYTRQVLSSSLNLTSVTSFPPLCLVLSK